MQKSIEKCGGCHACVEAVEKGGTQKQSESVYTARPWLREEMLVVTKRLEPLLQSSKLSETDKRLRALVHNIIVRDSEDVGHYHNINSQTLSADLKNNYPEVLSCLQQHDCLDINHIYSADVDAGFSKSYRGSSLLSVGQ